MLDKMHLLCAPTEITYKYTHCVCVTGVPFAVEPAKESHESTSPTHTHPPRPRLRTELNKGCWYLKWFSDYNSAFSIVHLVCQSEYLTEHVI